MRNLNKEFEHKNIEYNKLLEYGFTLKNSHYIFEEQNENKFSSPSRYLLGFLLHR